MVFKTICVGSIPATLDFMTLFKRRKSFLTRKKSDRYVARSISNKRFPLNRLRSQLRFKKRKHQFTLSQRLLRVKLSRNANPSMRTLHSFTNFSVRSSTKEKLVTTRSRTFTKKKKSWIRQVLLSTPYYSRGGFSSLSLFFSFQSKQIRRRAQYLDVNVPMQAFWLNVVPFSSILSTNSPKGTKSSNLAQPLINLLGGKLTTTLIPCGSSSNLKSLTPTVYVTLREGLASCSNSRPLSVTPLNSNLTYTSQIYSRLNAITGLIKSLRLLNNYQKIVVRRRYVFASTLIDNFGALDRSLYTRGAFTGNSKWISGMKRDSVPNPKSYQSKVIRYLRHLKRPIFLGPTNNLVKTLSNQPIHTLRFQRVNIKSKPTSKNSSYNMITPRGNNKLTLFQTLLLSKLKNTSDQGSTTFLHYLNSRRNTQTLPESLDRGHTKLLLIKKFKVLSFSIKLVRRFYFRFRRRFRRLPFLLNWIQRRLVRKRRALRFFYRTKRRLARSVITRKRYKGLLGKGSKWTGARLPTNILKLNLTRRLSNSKVSTPLLPHPLQLQPNALNSRLVGMTGKFYEASSVEPRTSNLHLLSRSLPTINKLSPETLFRYLVFTDAAKTTPTTNLACFSLNNKVLSLGVQNQLQSYFFRDCTSSLRLTNLWTMHTSRYTLRKRLLRFLSTASFQVDMTQWYYVTLIRFIEYCTGRKTSLMFGPFIEDALTFEEKALSNTWLNRLMGFKKRLGHRVFIKESLSVIMSALKLKDPTLLSNWICAMLKRLSFWKYRLVFRFLKFLILHLLKPHFWKLNFRGFKLRLKGKISVAGNARTRTLFHRIGDTSHSKIHNRVAYDLSLVHTFTGVMGLKVWFIY